MRLLINNTNVVISFGQFVREAGDNKIVDTDELTVKQILEIATATEAPISAKRKADIIEQLKGHLTEHNTEENTMSDSQKYEEIVVAGFEAEKSDNDIKKELFTAGMDFDDLNKTFNAIVAEKALRLSPKDRAVKAAEFLEGYLPDVNDVVSHLGKVTALQDFLECKTTQAGASMRKWAKDNDIELPKAPKASTVEPGYRGNQKLVADHAIANKDITFDELAKFASDNIEKTKGGKDSSRGYAVSVWNAVIFAKSYNAEVEMVEDTEEAA